MSTTPDNKTPGTPGSPKKREISFVAIDQIKQKLRARRKGKKANIRVAALNITSFLDMSFCLLMFLTLSAGGPGVKEGTFTSNLSRLGGEGQTTTAETETPKITRPINLTVSQRGENQYVIEIDVLSSSVSSFEVLHKSLSGLRQDPRTNPGGLYTPDSPIIIRPKNDVAWQGVIGAFNAAVRARFENVGFARSGS